MSRDHLRRFTERLGADQRLAEKFRALGDDPESWRKRAAGEGFELTAEEAGGLSSSYRELSDEELEDVAGGWPDGSDPSGSTTSGGGG